MSAVSPQDERTVAVPAVTQSPGPTTFSEAFPLSPEEHAGLLNSIAGGPIGHDDFSDIPFADEDDDDDEEENAGDDLANPVAYAIAQTKLQMEEQYQDFGIDIRDSIGNSAKKKESNAMKHFNYFLKKRSTVVEGETYVRGQELTYENSLENNTWWDNVIGGFFMYLAKNAKCRCQEARPRIGYQTATGYASSIKAYYMNKFRAQQFAAPVFQVDRWRQLRRKLLTLYQEETRKSGVSLTNPHIASTMEDRDALATGCIWMNNARSAEFWHLNNSMAQFAGRSSEVSLSRREHIAATRISEMNFRYDILQSFLKRQKNSKEQHVPIYPHRDGPLQDYYFSLIYRIIVMGDDESFLFPDFAHKASQTNADDKSDSKVSQLWSAYFKDLYMAFVEIQHLINKNLTSHCNKKGINQMMAENPNVSGLAQIFKSGWEVRGFHSIFDYVVGSQVMLHQAGKAVSGWSSKIGDSVVGGIPPTLEDISGDRNLVLGFVDLLFIRDERNVWPQSVRQLLAGSLLRHYDDFLSILETHPAQAFADPTKHIFVASIQQKLQEAGVAPDTFEEWQADVKKGFFNRNLQALPITTFPSSTGDRRNKFSQLLLDPRCFVDHINSLSAHYQGLLGQVDSLHSVMSGIARSVRTTQQQVHEIADVVVELRAMTTPAAVSPSSTVKSQSSVRSPGNSVDPCQFVKNFSVSNKRHTELKGSRTLAEHFAFFFLEQVPEGYEKDKKEFLDKDVDSDTRKKLCNQFTRLKKCVKILLMFCNNYPRPRPTSGMDIKEWEIEIRQLGRDAEARLRSVLFPDDPNKEMTQNTLATSKECKQWEKETSEMYRELPANTPVDTLAWWLGKQQGPARKRTKVDLNFN